MNTTKNKLFLFAFLVIFLSGCSLSDSENKITSHINYKLEINKEKQKQHSRINKGRISTLVIGKDGEKTDIIMLLIYNNISNKIDIISIPKDSYIDSNSLGAETKKINSIYSINGIEELSKSVKKLINQDDLDIDKYLILDYKSIREIVDKMDGIVFNIPDDTSSPSLINSELQKINGNEFIEILREKSNTESTSEESKKIFTEKFLSELSKNKLKSIITLISDVDTNINIKDLIKYGYMLKDIEKDNIKFHTLPGKLEDRIISGQTLYYYIVDLNETEKLMKEILSENKN